MTAKRKTAKATQEAVTQPILETWIRPYNWKVVLFTDEQAHREYVDARRDYRMPKDFYEACNGLASHIDSGTTAIYLDARTAGVLLHECVHAVMKCFDCRGVPMSYEATEVMAYTVQELFEECTEALNSV